MKMRDGGPAFPTDSTIGAKTEHHGMSLRDYFAGQAIQGVVASCVINGTDDLREDVRMAYRVADAMLAERERD